jgi:hypothetical protein
MANQEKMLIATQWGEKNSGKECKTMELNLALWINVAIFILYTIMLIVFSFDDARRNKTERAVQAKKAA